MVRIHQIEGLLFLRWLSFAGVVSAALLIAFDRGAAGWVLERDPSYISLVVLFILLLGLLRGGWVCLRLSREAGTNGKAVLRFRNSPRQDQDVQILVERLRGCQELGWFLAGLATKLGLLGTVIGFILMMSAVTQVENFDFSAAQDLIRRMTNGIGVALITTLVGLVASIILGVQSYFIERFGETLIADVVEGQLDIPTRTRGR